MPYFKRLCDAIYDDEVKIVIMTIQTVHVETVCLLSRK